MFEAVQEEISCYPYLVNEQGGGTHYVSQACIERTMRQMLPSMSNEAKTSGDMAIQSNESWQQKPWDRPSQECLIRNDI